MRVSLVLSVAIGLFVASCSGSSSDLTTESNSAESAALTIEGFSFGDALLVEVGTKVIIANADPVPHTWTSDDGLFDSGSIDPGGEFSFTFAEAGNYEFFCQIHPTMTGSITVEN